MTMTQYTLNDLRGQPRTVAGLHDEAAIAKATGEGK